LTPQSTNYKSESHFPIRKDTVEENPSIFTILKGDDRHKNKKKIKEHTSLYNQYIHHSAHSLKNDNCTQKYTQYV